MRIIRKIGGVLCIIIGIFLLIIMALIPIAFSVPADYNMGINWSAVLILVVMQVFFMTAGVLLFRWEHYIEKRQERERIHKEREREQQWQIREEKAHPVRDWYTEKKEAQLQRKLERQQLEIRTLEAHRTQKERIKQQETEQRKRLLDLPNGRIPQRAVVHYNRHAGAGYYLWFGLFLVLAVGTFLVIPAIVGFDRKTLGIITCILTIIFWIGFIGAIWTWQFITDSRTKAFLTTNEQLIYYVKFAARDYGREPYTKIGQLLHNAKVISAQSELRDAREAYLHSAEFQAMAERVINGAGVPERECMIECLNSPQIIRDGMSGMKLRYWNEKQEKWQKIKVPRSNEGYEKIRDIVKRRNARFELKKNS